MENINWESVGVIIGAVLAICGLLGFNLSGKISKISRELSELSLVLANGLADGKLTPEETKCLIKEFNDLKEAILSKVNNNA